jgi:glycerophosphoryl diester phosphodiesterase
MRGAFRMCPSLSLWARISAVVVASPLAAAAPVATDGPYEGPWRSSFDGDGSCWTEPQAKCNRALTIVHGGDWTLEFPYDSLPAMQAGFAHGADCVKGDFRVNGEGVGMVMHSSPIEWYESVECAGKRVENMTTAECEKCPMAASAYTFASAPELLSWADGHVNVMFCVKESRDVPRAISTLLEANASHRAMLELGTGVLLSTVAANASGWDEVYYIVEVGSHDELSSFLAAAPVEVLRRVVVLEWPNDWEKEWADNATLTADLAAVHAAGCKAVATTNNDPAAATKENHLAIWGAGFDAAYTYNLANAVAARVEVNTKRGLDPP